VWPTRVYCLDTSAILHAWRRDYPPDTFPTLWTRLEELIADGQIIAPDEVVLELERGGDEIHDLAQGQEGLSVEPDGEAQAVVQEIVDRWPEFVPEESHDGIWADPYVIAVASVTGATVVTGEVLAGANARKPKIPNVCHALGIAHTTLLGVLRAEGLTF
jgi:Domain of unknown function (DUF4411)